jgi:cytochrome o ubiquinol oxidase subunit II
MTTRKKKFNQGRSILFVFVVLISLGLVTTTLLRGNNVAVLNPKGYIAGEERKLMLLSVALLLEIAIPALILFYFTAWKYRESNEKATHDPQGRPNKSLVFSIWAFPFITMLLLASVLWPAAHKLAPQKSINSGTKPLTIQVIAMRWKWLFIYPEQGIAAVNFMQIPVDTPVQFDLTADETPMSSFWIPQLGGQLYAMTGHVNRLNLMANTAGDYAGRSAEINGAGFAGMEFTARASSAEDFGQWVQTVRQSTSSLNSEAYQKLLTPSENNHATFYANAGPDIYATMLTKYIGSHGGHTEHE